jgi:hypothetical protein
MFLAKISFKLRPALYEQFGLWTKQPKPRLCNRVSQRDTLRTQELIIFKQFQHIHFLTIFHPVNCQSLFPKVSFVQQGNQFESPK